MTMQTDLELINKILQQVSEELWAQRVSIETDKLIEEISFLQWVKHMENEYSAYSYCEE